MEKRFLVFLAVFFVAMFVLISCDLAVVGEAVYTTPTLPVTETFVATVTSSATPTSTSTPEPTVTPTETIVPTLTLTSTPEATVTASLPEGYFYAPKVVVFNAFDKWGTFFEEEMNVFLQYLESLDSYGSGLFSEIPTREQNFPGVEGGHFNPDIVYPVVSNIPRDARNPLSFYACLGVTEEKQCDSFPYDGDIAVSTWIRRGESAIDSKTREMLKVYQSDHTLGTNGLGSDDGNIFLSFYLHVFNPSTYSPPFKSPRFMVFEGIDWDLGDTETLVSKIDFVKSQNFLMTYTEFNLIPVYRYILVPENGDGITMGYRKQYSDGSVYIVLEYEVFTGLPD